MKSRMTKRQKFIASCHNPNYGRFASKKEIKEARFLARGKYWLEDLQFNSSSEDEDHDTFCAYSPCGKRYYFHFYWCFWATKKQQTRWKKQAQRAARLWCKGALKQALEVYSDIQNNLDK